MRALLMEDLIDIQHDILTRFFPMAKAAHPLLSEFQYEATIIFIVPPDIAVIDALQQANAYLADKPIGRQIQLAIALA